MALQRYKEERNGVQPNDEGNLVKFDDVIKLLEDIANQDPDISPKLAALKAVFKIMGKDKA